ncbi:MAG: hypothetical protein WAN81_09530 [Candidatus Binataceae bacterium]
MISKSALILPFFALMAFDLYSAAECSAAERYIAIAAGRAQYCAIAAADGQGPGRQALSGGVHEVHER